MPEDPPNVALIRLFAASHDEAEARRRLAAMLKDADAHAGAERMQAMWQCHPQAYACVHKIDRVARAGSSWSEVFDAAAMIDPRTAVALHCLGDADLLRAATDELVRLMQRWDVFSADSIVLDFGCGTGRIAAAIAPLVARVLGIDVSARMVDAARATVAHHANAAVIQAGVLTALRGDPFDVVLAVDSMPYVVHNGDAAALWEDVAALLRPNGVFLIFNYSYRGDPALDAADVEGHAARHGLALIRNGTQDLSLWDGRAFLLRKS